MKHYVVGILSMFENDLKLFKITVENVFESLEHHHKIQIYFLTNNKIKQFITSTQAMNVISC